MNGNAILKEAIQSREMTQAQLAEKAGIKYQSSISAILNRSVIKLDTFVNLLDAMGYKVIVTDGTHTWEVTQE